MRKNNGSGVSFTVDSQGFIEIDSDAIKEMLGSDETGKEKVSDSAKLDESPVVDKVTVPCKDESDEIPPKHRVEFNVLDDDNSSKLLSDNEGLKEMGGSNLKINHSDSMVGKEEGKNNNETTYVLPADEEEWKKMYDLIHIQLSTTGESNDAGVDELLKYENEISKMTIDKQVEVFEKLCKFADINLS